MVSIDVKRLGRRRLYWLLRAAAVVIVTVTGTLVPAARQVALSGHTDDVRFVAFLPEGKTLMSGADDHTVRLWDVDQNRELRVWQRTSEFDSAPSTSVLSLSADGLILARGGGAQGSAELWDVSKVARVRSIAAHQRPLIGLALSASGSVLATFSQEEARTWDAASGRALAIVRAPNLYVVRAVAVSANGQQFAVATSDKRITVCDAVTGKTCTQFDGGPGQLQALAFSPDGTLLAAATDGGSDSDLKMWNLKDNTLVSGVTGPSKDATAVAFSADGRFVAAAGLDVCVWDRETAHSAEAFPGHERPVRAMAFSPDGRLLATAGEDNLIGLWKLGQK